MPRITICCLLPYYLGAIPNTGRTISNGKQTQMYTILGELSSTFPMASSKYCNPSAMVNMSGGKPQNTFNIFYDKVTGNKILCS